MEIPVNRARIEFALEGTPYPVIAIYGEERLNHGFYIQVDIQTALDQHAQDSKGPALCHRLPAQALAVPADRRPHRV
jgi:hypothetical protein